MMNAKMYFRPVGLREAELILAAECKAFPPRLPGQPIFYPVMNAAYAEQIARDWNTRDEQSGYAGFVTRFAVARPYVDQFDEHQVGAAMHRELWIPAAELDNFNQHIIGQIEIIASFYG
jgi:hypothetical protein